MIVRRVEPRPSSRRDDHRRAIRGLTATPPQGVGVVKDPPARLRLYRLCHPVRALETDPPAVQGFRRAPLRLGILQGSAVGAGQMLVTVGAKGPLGAY